MSSLAFILSWLPYTPALAKPVENRDLLTAVLVFEAGGEGFSGMYAVASVIRNRAEIGKTTMTFQVLRKQQFSCLNGRTPYGLIQFAKARETEWQTAQSAIDMVVENPNWFDNTWGATHYEKKGLHPDWSDNMRITCTIRNHVFYAHINTPYRRK